MIDPEDVLNQLVELKLKYAPTGEDAETIRDHFEYELNHREIAILIQEGRILAFCDWSWVSCPEDMKRADRGERTQGDILYIIHLISTEPGLIWELRSMLPIHRWIIGEREGKLCAPKGLPNEATEKALA